MEKSTSHVLLTPSVALYNMVHDLRSYKHILQIDPECLPSTRYPHDRPVRVSVRMVLDPCLAGFSVPASKKSYSGAEEWSTGTLLGCSLNRPPTFDIPALGTSTELIFDLEDTCFSSAYY